MWAFTGGTSVTWCRRGSPSVATLPGFYGRLPPLPRVTGLATGLSPALVRAATRPPPAGQPIGGRRLGGVRRVALAQRRLPLPIRDLVVAFGCFAAEILNLAPQPLNLPLAFLPTGLMGVPMAQRRCLWLPSAPSRSRTHPPYVKPFRAICPAKPTMPPERLPILVRSVFVSDGKELRSAPT